jgi:hypothetical protein
MRMCVITTTPTLILASGVGFIFLVVIASIVARKMIWRANSRDRIARRLAGGA